MAEELDIDEASTALDEFRNRFVEAFNEYDEYLGCPQLTCGQFMRRDVLPLFEEDMNAPMSVRNSDYDTYIFFQRFAKKFAKEIAEYKEMKANFPDLGKNELRERYLDENKFSQDSLARMFNPFWKFDPTLE